MCKVIWEPHGHYCHMVKSEIHYFVTLNPITGCRKAALGGMVSGALGQFLASPTDLVKVQMQMEGKRRLEGKPPR